MKVRIHLITGQYLEIDRSEQVRKEDNIWDIKIGDRNIIIYQDKIVGVEVMGDNDLSVIKQAWGK